MHYYHFIALIVSTLHDNIKPKLCNVIVLLILEQLVQEVITYLMKSLQNEKTIMIVGFLKDPLCLRTRYIYTNQLLYIVKKWSNSANISWV